MLLGYSHINRREAVSLLAAATLAGVGVSQPNRREVVLAGSELKVLLEVVQRWLQEVASFDDQDSEFLAVEAVVRKVERRLSVS